MEMADYLSLDLEKVGTEIHLCCWSVGIKSMYHYAWLESIIFNDKKLKKKRSLKQLKGPAQTDQIFNIQ